jgi:AcrR family transcriptional regulator
MADSERTRTVIDVTAEPVSRQERKQRTRQALLDAALELLADRGFASLSLREVTKRAGIVPTAFYRHFTSMDELGVALVAESMRTLRKMIRSARTDRTVTDDIIYASVRTLYEHVRGNENHFRFLIRERYSGTGPVSSAIAVELRLLAGELAVDLARFEYLRDWSTEDLNMMADLIVIAMLATVTDLLDARPGDREDDDRIVSIARKRLRLIVLGVPNWRSRPE